MAAHNYTPVPASGLHLGFLQRMPPVRTTLTVDVADGATDEYFDNNWEPEPITGGDPIHIIGYFCQHQWSTEYTYGDIEITASLQDIDVPTTEAVSGQPVIAVELYVAFFPRWLNGSRSGSGGQGELERGSGDENCGLILSDQEIPYGPDHFELFVDDTQMLDVDCGAITPGGGQVSMALTSTLWLPGRHYDQHATTRIVSHFGDPHFPYFSGEAGSAQSFLFYAADQQPGESLPEQMSIVWTHSNMAYDRIRHPDAQDPGPFPGVSPLTVLEGVTAWVDVYPYIEREAGTTRVGMVV